LRLAFIWKKIDRQPLIPLMSGERKRTRVVTTEEEAAYLNAASQPWRTMATTMIELGPRPSEILLIRCENVSWESFTLSILTGKSAAAKRDLPLTDRAYDALHSWWIAIGSPKVGYLFPAIGSGSMHHGRAKKQGGSAKRTEVDVYRASAAVAGDKSRPCSSQRINNWHHEALEVAGFAEAQKEAGESLVSSII
jgi:integrase